ncbi:MAG TPA: hypothetical protein VFO67_16415 [Gemmatimonadales bacterium]|nr:hypothetical protein [Gemmatimonadales bacterium]
MTRISMTVCWRLPACCAGDTSLAPAANLLATFRGRCCREDGVRPGSSWPAAGRRIRARREPTPFGDTRGGEREFIGEN